jgi:hypothetical protein
MPKLEAVAIRMRQIFNDIKVLFPQILSEEQIVFGQATTPFAEDTIIFLNALSKELNTDPQARQYPDLVTFAFFCRRANILKLKDQYFSKEMIRLGRGVIFHITPSNVPVNFAYSLISGLLAGNVNIVRIPSKDFKQVQLICNAISRIAPTHKTCTSRIFLVRYDKLSKATVLFSSLCDVRIIWGGDETIAQIRKIEIPVRSFDVTFADRYSICAIKASRYLSDAQFDNVANGFYNDTYLFDQNACTAPHLILWIGSNEDVARSKLIFWGALHKLVKQKYGQLQPVIAVDKLTALYDQAIHNDGVHKIATEDNLIWRIEIDELHPRIEDYRCSSGYFCEYHGESLTDLTKVVNRKYQTLAYYGFEYSELSHFVLNSNLKGIDRIVPIGKTMDFSLTWDGYNIIDTLSRIININK